jgi:hypothetical protein
MRIDNAVIIPSQQAKQKNQSVTADDHRITRIPSKKNSSQSQTFSSPAPELSQEQLASFFSEAEVVQAFDANHAGQRSDLPTANKQAIAQYESPAIEGERETARSIFQGIDIYV